MAFLLLGILILIGFWLKSKRYSFERELKKCESPIEEQMLRALYAQGFKPYTQLKVGAYRLDIGLYYKGKKIAVECDGKAFHTRPEQREHDERRDRYLQTQRWMVLRFTGSDIYRDSEGCAQKIKSI